MIKDIGLIDFIDRGLIAQQKYAAASGIFGPDDVMPKAERYRMIIDNLGHMMEEVIEARRNVVRRPWKRGEVGCLDTPEKRQEFIEEMFDVLLFFRATLAYAQISGEEFCDAAYRKLEYNDKRKDHRVNI
jgi:hypothetical protein